MEDKPRLRRECLQARTKEADRTAKSEQIRALSLNLFQVSSAETILAYASCGSEVSTLGLLQDLSAQGKNVILPCCRGDLLLLFPFSGTAALTAGERGILEPCACSEPFPPAEIQAAIVPGVAFDRRGARLGRGAGCYDRFLRLLPPAVPIIGLAFLCQVIAEVPAEPHDVFVDLLITEAGIIDCRSNR